MKLKINQQSLKSRLLKNKLVDENGCWIWQRAVFYTGYPQIKIARKTSYAHRASYEVFKGQIPRGLNVCHKCDIRLCINPEHLFLGTDLDNERDKKSKMRHVYGTKNGRAILNENKVVFIRRLYKTGNFMIKELAIIYNLSPSGMAKVVNCRTWKYLI